VLLAILLVLLLGSGGAYAFVTLRVPTHEVPNLVGLQEEQAMNLVNDFGWDIVRKEDRRDDTVPGEILSQSPDKGTELKEGETLTITVSLGNTLVTVPTNLVGLSMADALTTLQAAGLVLGEVTPQFDEEVPADHVLAVPGDLPAQLPKGDPVALVVSQGPQPRTVPTLPPGTNFEQAKAALGGVQLQAVGAQEFSDTVPAGQVIRTEPAAGAQVPRGSKVTVVVSKGVELIPVPKVQGMSLDQAVAALQGAGLTPGQVFGPADGHPDSTDPEQGKQVPRGTVVDIYLKR
jgi:serine/threonine-protein kinase